MKKIRLNVYVLTAIWCSVFVLTNNLMAQQVVNVGANVSTDTNFTVIGSNGSPWVFYRTGDVGNDELDMGYVGDSLQYAFTGAGVDVLCYYESPTYYQVFIDGTLVKTAVTGNNNTFANVIYSTNGMVYGLHTVQVVNYGPNGDGSDLPQTWSPYVQIDSLNIYSDVAASSVTVLPATPNVYVNSTLALSATVLPSNADNHVVTWSSSNTGVATVDTNGVVTAVSVGSATITATTAGLSTVAGSSTVTVVNPPTPATSVALWPAAFSLNAGSSAQLVATISPSGASNQQLFWTSSNPGVATVNSYGVVTAKTGNLGTVNSNGVITVAGPSSVTITATSADGSHTATSTITVVVPGSYIVNVGAGTNDSPNIDYTNVGWGFANLREGDINGDEFFLGAGGQALGFTFQGIGVTVLMYEGTGAEAPYFLTLDGQFAGWGQGTATNNFQVPQINILGLPSGTHKIVVTDMWANGGFNPWIITDAFQVYTNVIPTVTGSSISGGGSAFTVTGTGATNQLYVLQKTLSLSSPVWSSVSTNVANGSGVVSLTDNATAGKSQGFYRIAQ